MKNGVLIIVENLTVPTDRRVWQEATTLTEGGYNVTVVCPVSETYTKRDEVRDGIRILRHPLPREGSGFIGYLLEYSTALFWEFALAWKAFFARGFKIIHACNPPDTIFLVGLVFKVFGTRFVFDHHDINPELYEAKFNRRDSLYRVLLLLERATFWMARISIATNESYKRIAIERGKMRPNDVYVVRSSPDLAVHRVRSSQVSLKRGRAALVGYVGVMGPQDGLDCLLRAINYIVSNCRRNDIQFLLVGSGTELDSLRAYAEALQISDYVTFAGFLHGQDLRDALASIDVGVAPDPANAYNDKCTMNKVLEYMAFSKPIVQFDLTEGRRSAGSASLYAQRNDEQDFARKVLTLVDDTDLRRSMGDCGRRRIERNINWSVDGRRLLEAYARLVPIGGAGSIRH